MEGAQAESEDHMSYPGLGAPHSASWDLVSSSAKDEGLRLSPLFTWSLALEAFPQKLLVCQLVHL